jgi:hypothetical protein
MDEQNSSQDNSQNNQMSQEERIGYHKGALSTLVAERSELLRIVSITEQLMQAHIKELQSLGVKVETSDPKDSQ